MDGRWVLTSDTARVAPVARRGKQTAYGGAAWCAGPPQSGVTGESSGDVVRQSRLGLPCDRWYAAARIARPARGRRRGTDGIRIDPPRPPAAEYAVVARALRLARRAV